MSGARGCGTYGGYQQHSRNGSPVCDECRIARNAYMKAFRATNPSVVSKGAELAKMRLRALNRLASRHAEEFAEMYAAERVKVAGR